MDHIEHGQRTVGGRGGFEVPDQAVLVLLQVKNGLIQRIAVHVFLGQHMAQPALSEGLGVPARKITTPEEFKEGLKWAMNLGGPAVLECVVDPSEKVWPMVAPGASLMETFSEEDLEKK